MNPYEFKLVPLIANVLANKQLLKEWETFVNLLTSGIKFSLLPCFVSVSFSRA